MLHYQLQNKCPIHICLSYLEYLVLTVFHVLFLEKKLMEEGASVNIACIWTCLVFGLQFIITVLFYLLYVCFIELEKSKKKKPHYVTDIIF